MTDITKDDFDRLEGKLDRLLSKFGVPTEEAKQIQINTPAARQADIDAVVRRFERRKGLKTGGKQA
jgi:hypothetical protein